MCVEGRHSPPRRPQTGTWRTMQLQQLQGLARQQAARLGRRYQDEPASMQVDIKGRCRRSRCRQVGSARSPTWQPPPGPDVADVRARTVSTFGAADFTADIYRGWQPASRRMLSCTMVHQCRRVWPMFRLEWRNQEQVCIASSEIDLLGVAHDDRRWIDAHLFVTAPIGTGAGRSRRPLLARARN